VSLLKKHELDLKKHAHDLREAIRANWSSTSREIKEDLRSLWSTLEYPGSPTQESVPGTPKTTPHNGFFGGVKNWIKKPHPNSNDPNAHRRSLSPSAAYKIHESDLEQNKTDLTTEEKAL
jgi:hypothetical protein